MATRKPSKAREFDYSNVGKAGRRTGITLKEGRRDEHGMEEIDGMFSSPEKSPEKSPVKTNGRMTANEAEGNSEDMETGGSSSIPEPADLLASRQAGRNSLLPPRRSPMKTFMSGSPRRSSAIRSSPMPQSDQVSSPSRSAAKRALDYSTAQTHGGSPLKVTHPRPDSKGKGRAVEVDEGVTADFSDDDANHLLEEDEEEEDQPEAPFVEAPGDYHEGAEMADAGDDDPEEQTSPSVIASASKAGRKRKSDMVDGNEPNTARQGGRENANGNPDGKRRGRKPKAAAQREAEDESRDQRPAKKAKTSKPKRREGNVQISAEQQNEVDQVVDDYTKRNGPLDKNRSLCILRRENPEDDAVKHTRSGRVSVRPLAWWRNEKFVYGDGNDVQVGQRFPVSTIKEIIRMEEQDTESGKRGQKGKRRAKKPKSKANRDEPSDDEAADQAEPWETDTGVFYGPVKVWDPELQSGTQDEEMMDIGYAPAAIQTHEVKDSTFRFAKILSTPFIGSGFVDMPPGAVKKQKNSKKMHMVFFVHHGRIHVEVAGLRFSAGKGCVFQVPRGNNYSFENDYDHSATIFFTQGCIPLDGEGNVDTTVTAPPLPDPSMLQGTSASSERASEKPEKSEQPPKKRGRPKQK